MPRFDDDIRQILAAHQAPEPDADRLLRTKDLLQKELAFKAQKQVLARRAVNWRLAFAGLGSLPVILGLNYLIWLLLSFTLSRFLPEAMMSYLMVTFAAWVLIGLSLIYGSLPVIGSWATRRKGFIKYATT